ncbi:MAG TPA: DUF3857 domain-containing protein [Candidatus Limnocylindrales bacterium]|nr:DUF3857 domain-containing protein [Candidatus Limnocylindrales bacterium]
MSRKTRFAVTVLVALACSAPLLGSSPSAPDWLHQAAAKAPGKYAPETNAVVLLDDTTLTVTGPGQADETRRRIVLILRPQGREEAKLHVFVGPGDKVQAIHAWTIDSAGVQYEVKDKEFIEVSPYEGALYTDIRFRTAEAPAGNPGSLIGWEYTTRRHIWMDQWHWFVQENIPVEETRLTLQLPASWEYKASWANQAAQQPAQTGPNRWQWICLNLPGIPEEHLRPASEALEGHLELAFYEPATASNLGSWKAIGDWYYKLVDGRRNPSPEMSARVQQLTAGATTFDGKVRALTAFLQSDVRYVEISIGIGGYQPHPAADVYRSRYGDCKDKVTLLSSMLKEAGIDSEYVLVDSERGVVKPDVPSTLFNHAILAIDLPKDVPPNAYRSVSTTTSGTRYLIFDPTDEYTPVGDLRTALQGSYGLLVTKSGGELIKLPVLLPDTNRFDREGKFTLQADGSLSGTVTERFTGTHAARQRAWLGTQNESERAKSLDHRLGESLKNVSVQQLKVQDLAAHDKELTLTYQLTAQSYAQKTGPLVLVRGRVLGEKAVEINWAKRKFPIQLSGATSEKDSFEIQIPPGFAVDDLPEPKQIDVGFASYKSKVEANGSTLHYTREYVVRDPYIGSDHFSDLRKLEGTIGDDEFASAVLKKTP